jgi:hypothetical protein
MGPRLLKNRRTAGNGRPGKQQPIALKIKKIVDPVNKKILDKFINKN